MKKELSVKKKLYISAIIIIAILVIDQIIKYEVKTNMTLGQHIVITNWFQLVFVENNGMAFGMELWGGKLFLTIFRIVAIAFLGWLIWHFIKKGNKMGYITCLTMIFAGAIGNLIDCLFYGEIFSQSTHFDIAEMVPWGEGYSSILMGKVVDMFYFPLVEWDMPGWMWLNDISFLPDAYEHCVFFSPIFNFADACISCGVIALILFYRKTIAQTLSTQSEKE